MFSNGVDRGFFCEQCQCYVAGEIWLATLSSRFLRSGCSFDPQFSRDGGRNFVVAPDAGNDE